MSIQFSYSELDTYRQCRHKHQLAYLEGWTPEGTAPALARGTAFHAILEAHYQLIASAQETGGVGLDDPRDERFGRIKAVRALPDDEINLLEWMYDGYIEQWGGDSDWEIVATEQKFQQDIGFGVLMHATIDLIVRKRSNGTLWIVDHKTCKNLPKSRELDLDDQLAIYIWMTRQHGIDVTGGINNSIRTHRNIKPMRLDERFSRYITVRTPRELETCVAEARQFAIEAYDPERAEDGSALLSHLIDRVRSPNMETCFWKCPFTEACLVGRKDGPARGRGFLRDSGFTVRVPHAHEPTEGELERLGL